MKTMFLAVGLVITPAAFSQDRGGIPIAEDAKFAWHENVGYINFADAGEPVGSQAVRVGGTFLSGFAWGENIGWINFGDGSPADGVAYANETGEDFGVNVDPETGDLFGLAWAENVGWINFDTRASLGPFSQQARIDLPSLRFRGYAWGENIGWLNLDDTEVFVGLRCVADWDGDGAVGPADVVMYAMEADGGLGFTDLDDDGDTDAFDLILLLEISDRTCP